MRLSYGARLRSVHASALSLSLFATACSNATDGPALPPATEGQKRWATQCKDADDWNRAGPPFRIWGNSWYVGTCGIAAILITGDKGHILIDGGPRDGGALVARNIATLGFRLADVKLLLMSHEHHDHVGGLAELRRLTGAGLLASEQAARVMQSGGTAAPDDPQAGSISGFAPVPVDGFVTDGEPVQYGAIKLIPHATPGHTPGALSWHWRSCDGADCRTIVYADSLSPVSAEAYRFSAHPEYVARFRQSLRTLAGLDCDILLAPHPSAARMRARLLSPQGLADRGGCRSYAQAMQARLDSRLAKEAGKKP